MLPDNLSVDHASALAAVPWLSRVDRIALSVNTSRHIAPGVLAPLIASQHLGGIRCFDFGSAGYRKRGVIAASEVVALVLAKSATALREFPLSDVQEVVTTDASPRRSHPAFLSAVEQIVSSKRAKQFTSFGDEVVEMDEALAKILLGSNHLTGIGTFPYSFAKITAKTRAAFIERFSEPERV